MLYREIIVVSSQIHRTQETITERQRSMRTNHTALLQNGEIISNLETQTVSFITSLVNGCNYGMDRDVTRENCERNFHVLVGHRCAYNGGNKDLYHVRRPTRVMGE